MSTDPTPLADVRGASVRVGEIFVGTVSDLFADVTGERIVGLEISSPDGRRWFLPWVAASVESGVVHSWSPLVFFGSEQLDFYARHGVRLVAEGLGTVAVTLDGQMVRSPDDSASVLATAGEGIPVA